MNLLTQVSFHLTSRRINIKCALSPKEYKAIVTKTESFVLPLIYHLATMTVTTTIPTYLPNEDDYLGMLS